MNKDTVSIPYYVAEGMIDRQSAIIKKLWIMCLLLIILLVGSNGLWLWYESQWSYYEQEVEQEIENEMEDGDFTVIGIGDFYGKSKTACEGEIQSETGGR